MVKKKDYCVTYFACLHWNWEENSSDLVIKKPLVAYANVSEDKQVTYHKQDCTERIGPTGKWITHLKFFRFYFWKN